MDKKSITDDLLAITHGSGFITATAVAAYFGECNSNRFKANHLKDLPTFKKKYYIPDVVERVLSEVKHG